MTKIINMFATVSGRFAAVALGGLVAIALPAFGTTVDYTTTGTFSSTSNNILVGSGGETLTFNGVPGLSSGGVNSTPATDSLGYFMVTNSNGGSLTPPSGETFTLNLTQSEPTPVTTGSFTSSGFTGTLSDTANVPGGGLILTLAQTSITVNGITYTLQNLNNGDQLAIGTGLTNVQTTITGAVGTVPEPLSMGLLGGGLAILGLARLRRKTAK